jgi:CheY-like chemotaxis protein
MDVSEPCDILLIEPDPNHAGLMTLILAHAYGDSVRVATSGLHALELARQAPPALAIVRLMAADSTDIDGYELCRLFKADPELRAIPVLVFAARSPAQAYSEAQQCGAEGYLYQPYQAEMLYAARSTLLGGERYYPPVPS